MSTFFTTIAQISFTIAGLIIVALAGDSETRHYWFGNRHRRLFAHTTLSLVLLPGLVSIFSLIPLYTPYPSWLFSTGILGCIFVSLSIYISRLAKTETRQTELNLKLQSSLLSSEGCILSGVAIFALIMFHIKADGLWENFYYSKILLTFILSLFVMTSAYSVIELLNSFEDSKKNSLQKNVHSNKLDDSEISNTQNHSPVANEDTSKVAAPNGKTALTIVLVGIVTFLFSRLLSKDR